MIRDGVGQIACEINATFVRRAPNIITVQSAVFSSMPAEAVTIMFDATILGASMASSICTTGIIDIKAKAGFPAAALSNFAAYSFSLDGVALRSMEGFLQSLKFPDPVEQSEICSLVGAVAQARGRRQDWNSGTLWWRAKSYDRFFRRVPVAARPRFRRTLRPGAQVSRCASRHWARATHTSNRQYQFMRHDLDGAGVLRPANPSS